MSAVNPLQNLNDCGCCAGVSVETPVEVSNRPGLSAIVYRTGTHVTFKESMLARLSSSNLPALSTLKTRDNDDFSIALLDAWATVGDVLTFYQERIANESYLRTATERLSLLQMARLIGYGLRPGVAASTLLAFTLEDAAGAPLQSVIEIGVKAQSVPGPGEKPQTFETIEKIEARTTWNALKPQMVASQQITSSTTELYLQGVNTQLQIGDAIVVLGNERETTPSSGSWDFRFLKSVEADAKNDRTRVTWDKGLSGVAPVPMQLEGNARVFALRQRASLFGHNAPDWKSMPESVRKAYNPDLSSANWPDFSKVLDGRFDLDAAYSKVVQGSWFAVLRMEAPIVYKAKAVVTFSRARFAMSARVTSIEPDFNPGAPHPRFSSVYAQSEELTVAQSPLSSSISGDSVLLNSKIDALPNGRTILFSGKDDSTGEAITEAVRVLRTQVVGNVTQLFFTPSLLHSYERASLTIYANVAHATHGETMHEVLGSGDASRPYQRFTLRQPPLTYTSAATPSGAQSTLQVRVNDLLWLEVPTLYAREPHEHVYVTQQNEDGTTTVQFGDGINGARLPTGSENVRATYRKGIGLGGLADAEQISLLMTRPLGVKGVINPQPATGAADAETIDDVRTNAPLTVMTLDRTVSLRDYEDFARAFGGIAKALATWTWEGRTRRVFITIAGPQGAEIKADSDTYKFLVVALRSAGDPFVSFRVASYRAASFRLIARVKIEPDFENDRVLAAVEDALHKHFSFAARSFGQPVALSEVIALVQAVPGVVAVDVKRLHRSGAPRILNHRLLADMPAMGAGGHVNAAELLTLHESGVALGVMS
ncbi:MAG TPA: putative baseplate assembly protein [Abditibacteriaceae bacterium]|jgi:hypothetical protein